jgi:hypothetical protein
VASKASLPQPELVYLLTLNHRHSKEIDTIPLREREGTSPDGGAVFQMGDARSTCELVLGRNQGLKLGQAAEVLQHADGVVAANQVAKAV